MTRHEVDRQRYVNVRSPFFGKPFGPAELGAAVRRVFDPVEMPAG